MPRNLTYQAKSLLLALLVLLLWWFTPALFKRWTGVIFQEFQAPAWTALSYLGDLQSYWAARSRSKSELIEAGVDLSRLNAAYALRNQRADTFEREVRRMESFFNLPSYTDYRYEVARVVKRDLTGWWQNLVIRKGLNYDIEPGQAVVFSGGVVGRVSSVSAYTATVELISSPRFRSAAHIEGDDRPVEFRGGINPGLMAASGSVATVPADMVATLKNPLRLTSSRLGGVFPDGLTLGWVYRLDPSPDGLFQSGVVRLDPRLQTLREVAVMIPLRAREEEEQ
ncbi:rod shape-determining protein MreC [Puniceicoccales bacterium CK1056]|uniref:Cell shape-determining protein MreC n=1 Tax=Oceanipulchritudo coccoides TaxID=2706888 RepID=A0A6B2LYU2_9BACT|nr:rod shape-determining protein MreC [Oceanipulchritudo coccoides]NDV61226.1 rod shape-determining protein MreC [Oceanipulchritudo coccoides]